MALGARQQVKIWKLDKLSRHYIAEISLNVTLNHNQPTNQPTNVFIAETTRPYLAPVGQIKESVLSRCQDIFFSYG